MTAARQAPPQDDDDAGGAPSPAFAFEVEGMIYTHHQPKITGGEIMDVAGIPRPQGLVRVHADGTTASVTPDADVYLVRGLLLKRRPRFRRG